MTFLMWNRPMTEIPTRLIAFQRPLPSSNFGHRRHPPAPNQAVARDPVLGRLSDGHPFQRHLHLAVAEAARDRVLSQRLDARRQASPRHGHPRAQPAVRSGRDRRGQPAAARHLKARCRNFAVRNTAATAIVKTDGWRGCRAVPRGPPPAPCRRRFRRRLKRKTNSSRQVCKRSCRSKNADRIYINIPRR